MAHPFFDASTFPWLRDDAKALHTRLWQTISLRAAAVTEFQKSAGMEVPPPAEGLSMDLFWTDALDRLVKARALKKLCENILQNPALRSLHDVVTVVIDAKDAVDLTVIDDDILFLDRDPFRRELSRIRSQAGTRRVLLVRGEPKSGKSWSRHLIERVARDDGAECLYLYQPVIVDLGSVFAELFVAVGASLADVPHQDSSEDAWYRKICLTLQERAKRSNKLLWIVVDDLGFDGGSPKLDPAICDFFEQFALRMENPAFRAWFRLVLLDYPAGKIPTRWKANTWSEDTTRVSDIQSVDVVEFLKDWTARRALQVTDAALGDLASGLIAEIDTAPSPPAGAVPVARMQRIQDALPAVLATLGGGVR
jgi:hypothetical protein